VGLAWGEKGEEGEGVGDVMEFRLGAVGDAGEVHAGVGVEEQVEVAVKLGTLRLVEVEGGALCELGPQFNHE
jgi:hypothetical protein